MTWDAYHRRKDLLREIFAIADQNPHCSLTDLLDAVDPQREVLDDETAALFEIQMAWFQRLSGHVDRLTTDGGETPEMVAVAAWAAAAAEMPGARALLDAHLHETALAKAFAKERAFLAASAGVPARDPDPIAHGDRIISSARSAVVRGELAAPTESIDDDRQQRQGLIARLRSVIAA